MRLIFGFVILLVLMVNSVLAWRSFMRGRSKDGNLGEPILSMPTELPKDQWFTQYLDHFNAAEGRVWKQVKKAQTQIKCQMFAWQEC